MRSLYPLLVFIILIRVILSTEKGKNVMIFTHTMSVSSALDRVNEWVWGPTLLTLVLGIGVWLSVRTDFVQVRRLGTACRLFRHAEGDGEGVSPFGVLCTALSAAIGTGNIVGVATAVSAGGPGAIFWMLLSAFFGMATKFAEGVLAVKYRTVDGGEVVGGPFYYIEQGMGTHFRWLGKLFALFGAFAGLFGIGTVTQSNSITAAVESLTGDSAAITVGGASYSQTTVLVGIVVTVLAAMVILGGIGRISRVATVLVPLMLCVYVGAVGTILLSNIARIPAAMSLILRAAFAPRAALGAAAGITVKHAVRLGVGRGIFSNEAGMGTEAIAAAASRTTSPVQQGLLCMMSTFIDTIVLCTAAGLTLVVTDAYRQVGLHGVEMTAYAWAQGLPCPPSVSRVLLMLCLAFFAFSTILGWNFYAEQCMRYLCGGRTAWMRSYRIAYIAAVFIGPYLSVSSAWTVADIGNGCMMFPNLVALLSLSGEVVCEARAYFAHEHEKSHKKRQKPLDGRRKG